MKFRLSHGFPIDLLSAGLIFLALSATSYFTLQAFFGYTYELILLSNVAFTAIGLSLLTCKRPESFMLLPLCFVAILALSEELLLNSIFPWYGLALALACFVLLPLVGAILTGENMNARVVFEIVGLLFATRIVFSPFPVGVMRSALILPAIYSLIMVAVVFYIWFRNIPLTKVGLGRGLTGFPLQLIAGISIGTILGLIEYPILKPEPISIGPSELHNILYLLISMMVLVGLTEELLYRGLLQSHMELLMPKWKAVHLTSLIFSLFHIGWLNPIEVLFAYSAGVVFGYLFIKTRSVLSPALAHGFGNVVLYFLPRVI